MSSETQELIRIYEQLSESKKVEVVDFARFLLARQGDERWEGIIADPKPLPKFDTFLCESRMERAEPLDPDRL